MGIPSVKIEANSSGVVRDSLTGLFYLMTIACESVAISRTAEHICWPCSFNYLVSSGHRLRIESIGLIGFFVLVQSVSGDRDSLKECLGKAIEGTEGRSG